LKSLICIRLKGRHSSGVELEDVIRNDGEASMKNLRRQRVRRGAQGWPQAQRIKDDSSIGGQFASLMKVAVMSREATC
jgi:hypothetical protein